MGNNKSYDELTLSNSFIFYKVMTTHPELCKGVLELVLEKKISMLRPVEGEKYLKFTPESKGVRLDICFEGENEIYNLEMQATDEKNLPKRSRYYHSMLNLHQLEKGMDYRLLKPTYVIFICTFDLFKKGLPLYCFENTCREDANLTLGDEASTIFLNAAADADGALGELNRLVRNEDCSGELVNDLKKAISEVKCNPLFMEEYMKYECDLVDAREEGKEQGIEIGKEQGIEIGKEQGQIDIIFNMKRKGFTIEQIADIADKTIEEIRLILDSQLTTV